MDLSIIIPTYNRNHTLAECLQALEHNDVEFVVVDDGSETPVEAPPNVRVIRHESNRGRAAALNTGLKAASHDLVLILDDDIFAAPDMVVRLVDDFMLWNNPKLALVGRVVWDPEIPMTLTMQWMEEVGPFHDISQNRSAVLTNLYTGNTLLWRSFVLEHGGFDENFSGHTLEDTELGLRLKGHGLEVRLLPSAVGYHNKMTRIQDLANRRLQDGFAAVYLHSKFSDYFSHVDDVDGLLSNLEQETEAATAVEQIARLEERPVNQIPTGTADLIMLVYRHYTLKGMLDGLDAVGTVQRSRSCAATLGLYDEAEYLEALGELSEARRIFRLVRERQDKEYWAAAEYHLGAIESQFGNAVAAQNHFMDCLRLDPEYEKARTALSVF